MCAIDWAVIASWLSAVTGVGTLVVALVALNTWKAQLHGTTRHDVANQIATAARSLRYAFYDARSAMIVGWEWPGWASEGPRAGERYGDQIANEYRHVYTNRTRELFAFVRACLDLRARAWAVFGEECAISLENLARKAREFEFIAEEFVEQIRVGPKIVNSWNDQEWVARVKGSIGVTSSRDDPYSLEFEAAFHRLHDKISVDLLQSECASQAK